MVFDQGNNYLSIGSKSVLIEYDDATYSLNKRSLVIVTNFRAERSFVELFECI